MFLKRVISKSFCLGIIVASFTWVVTILLYWNISRNINVKQIEKVNSSKWQDLYTSNLTRTLFDTRDEFGIIRNLQDQHVRDIGYKQHAFNTLVSNNIGLFREIPDTRHKICLKQNYSSTLPAASIIMCFYNEHMMTLLRSLTSIFRRTPSTILKEIILVDDFSDFDDLRMNLEEELAKIDDLKKVKLIRNSKREGLIRARVIGSHHATGEILVFLDSHIEVNVDWIQPLLDKVLKENTTLAVPVIDIINADTFAYTPSPLVRGGFNWGLHFKWENLPEGTLINESSFAGPFISPTMAGGLFAINRFYFKYIGEYDMGMDIWGGENLEISFRVWQCGGAIKIMPCSRVGHIFRKRRPYGSPEGTNTMLRNSLRAAYVWMDEYKEFFLNHQKVNRNFDYGNVDDRLLLRQQLNCKPFYWYIKNIYPEIDMPGKSMSKSLQTFFQPWHSRKRTYTSSFLLRLSNASLCISVDGAKVNGLWKRGSTLSLRPCLRTKNQIWYETDKSELILDKLYCLEASYSSGYSRPVLGKCHEMQGDQEWRHLRSVKTPIYNSATGTCLRALKVSIGAEVVLDLCSKENNNAWDVVTD